MKRATKQATTKTPPVAKRAGRKTAASTTATTTTPATTPANPLATIDVSSRAMIVSLSISRWKATKVDHDVTRNVAAQHDADADAGIYRKQLISKSALERIQKVVSAAREEHARRTLPWYDGGQRIVLSSAYFEYCKAMDAHRDEFNRAVAEFLDGYEERVESERAAEKKRLGRLYKEIDYPSKFDVSRKFAFRIAPFPLPSRDDFRVGFSQDEMTKIVGEFDKVRNETIRAAMHEVFTRVADVVRHMATRLRMFTVKDDGKVENTFRDSLVGNVQELVALLPSLNLTADPRLDNLLPEIQRLTLFTPEQLRGEESARTHTAELAEAILKKMEAFV